MTADEHAPKRRGNKNAQRRVSGKKKKKSRTGNGEIIDRKWDQNKNKNQFRQPGRSPGGNTRSPEMGYSQQTNNSDQFHNNGNNGNHELVREVNQLQGSVQLLHQQFQQLGLNHQLIMGKYDAEISKLTLEIQTLRDKMGRNSRKMKNLRAKLSSIETMEVQLQRAAQLQREPAIKLKKKKNPVAESKRKKTRAKIPDTPTQCPVCMKTFKLKRNFSKHQNKTKHGLEGSSISDNLSASPEKTGQSNVSREQKDSPNAVFAEVSPAQTSSNSHENVDPQEVEIVASCHYRPLNNDVSNPVILNETINSTSPAAKSVIFPEKLSESFQNMSPNKRKRVSEIVSLVSEDEDVPGIEIKQEKNACPSCQSCFDDEDLLTEHIKSSCPKNLCCQFCKKRFIRVKSLNLHLKTHERPTDLYKCPTCKKSFKCLSTLQVHKELHLNERPYECLECGKCYRKENHLESHTKTMHENTYKLFACKICSKSFATEKLLEKHFRTHPFCIECGHSFKTGGFLASHVKGFHGHLRARVCSYCCQMIKRNDWNQHCRNCELKPKQTVICFYCNQIFITSLCLKRHIKSKHEGLPFQKA